MMNWQLVGEKVTDYLREHASTILTWVGIGAGAATTVIAVKQTPKAIEKIEEKKKELNVEKLSTWETVKAAAPCYIVPVCTGVTAVACVIGAHTIDGNRNVALLTACSTSMTALKEYKDKVEEVVGDKKAEEIRKSVNQDKMEKTQPPTEAIIPEGQQNQLCYDVLHGRYFYSTYQKMRDAAKDITLRMCTSWEPAISLNEFWMELGLPTVLGDDELGWNTEMGEIELHIDSNVAPGGIPCLTMEFITPPDYRFKDFMK